MIIRSKFAGSCAACGEPYARGAEVDWVRGEPGARCLRCTESGRRPVEPPDEHERYVDRLARGLPERTRRVRDLVEAGRVAEAAALGVQLVIDVQVCFRAGFELVRSPAPEADEG